jgi:hypothetical protein
VRDDTPEGALDDEDPADDDIVEDVLDDDVSQDDVDDEPPVGPVDRTPIPAARSIRRYTHAVAGGRTGAGLTELFGDVYYAALVAGIGVAMAFGALQQLVVTEAPAPVGHDLSITVLVVAALVSLAGGLLSLAGRLGPIGVGGAEGTWWLTLPVDRRGLLRGSAWRLPALAGVAAGLVTGVLTAATPVAPAGSGVLVGVAAAFVAAAAVALAGLVQGAGGSRPGVGAGDVLVACGPLVALAGLATAWRPGSLPAVPWWALAVLAVALAAAVAALDARLGTIPARALRESGAVAAHAAGALASMDSRELGRALSDRLSRPARRRSLRLRLVAGPVRAFAAADLLVLVRSPRHLAQLVGTAVLPLVVVSTPGLAGSVQVTLTVLIGGYVAAIATGEGARRAEMVPTLDRLLPMSAREVRRARLLVPAITMTLWSVVALGAVGLWRGDPWPWLGLGVLVGPAWAGAALRSAYRPAPEWGKALVSTPMGALPTGAATVLARGPDAALVGVLPTLVAVLVGGVPETLVWIQIATTLIALTWGSGLQERSMMDRMLESSSQQQDGARGTAQGRR